MVSKEVLVKAIEQYNELVDIVKEYDNIDDLYNLSPLDAFNYDGELFDCNYKDISTTIYSSMQVDKRLEFWIEDYAYTLDLSRFSKRLDNSQKLCYSEHIKEGIQMTTQMNLSEEQLNKLNDIIKNSGAEKFAFDGCHKIYLIETDGDEVEAIKTGYIIMPIKLLAVTFDRSCGLRFIHNWKLDKTYISQFEFEEEE